MNSYLLILSLDFIPYVKIMLPLVCKRVYLPFFKRAIYLRATLSKSWTNVLTSNSFVFGSRPNDFDISWSLKRRTLILIRSDDILILF